MTNKLVISQSHILIKCDRDDECTRGLLSSFYPVHSNRIGTEHALSIRNIENVLQTFRGVTAANLSTVPQSIQDIYTHEINARNTVQSLMSRGPTEDCVVNSHLTLRRHQQLGREIAKARSRYCFFFDTRTGKTPLSLSIMWDDIKAHPEHKWLVVCPLILIDNAWLEDACKFIPELKTISCHAATKAQRLRAIQSSANIYVTNIESFDAYKEYFYEAGFHGCIVDESSTMKSAKSKQSKALVDFAQSVKRFYLLSGTPAPNGEWEYYMQLKSVDYYCVPPSYTKFKERYFVNTSYNPQFEKLVLRPDAKEDFLSLIQQYAIYMDKEDVLTTPGRTFVEVPIQMPEDLRKYYVKMKNELAIELGDSLIVVNSAAAKLNKLNQMTSGFVIDTQAVKENKFYNENRTECTLLSSYRFDKLMELLESADLVGEQVLIWANYRYEFDTLKGLLGDRCRCVYGGTTLAEKNEAIKLFKNKQIQYLIANPASADKGLTLTNCHICIYFSLNWSYELFKQSTERIYGDISKQPKHCMYYIIIADKSIDGVLYNDVLQNKASASMAILNHLKEG